MIKKIIIQINMYNNRKNMGIRRSDSKLESIPYVLGGLIILGIIVEFFNYIVILLILTAAIYGIIKFLRKRQIKQIIIKSESERFNNFLDSRNKNNLITHNSSIDIAQNNENCNANLDDISNNNEDSIENNGIDKIIPKQALVKSARPSKSRVMIQDRHRIVIDKIKRKKKTLTPYDVMIEYLYKKNPGYYPLLDKHYNDIKIICNYLEVKCNLMILTELYNSILWGSNMQFDSDYNELSNILEKKKVFNNFYGFIIEYSLKYDTKLIDSACYGDAFEDLVCYLTNNKNYKCDLDDVKRKVFKLKHIVYLNHLKGILKLNKLSDPNEIIRSYISYFGTQTDNEYYTKLLSNILQINITDTTEKICVVKSQLIREHKLNNFERTLQGNKMFANIEEIDQMGGYEFEVFLSKIFTGMGFKVLTTSFSGDYGADLVVSDLNRKYAIQAKNYSSNVGISAVQEIVSAREYYSCSNAIVISNSFYTKAAIALAMRNCVTLIDREDLVKIINEGKHYFYSKVL